MTATVETSPAQHYLDAWREREPELAQTDSPGVQQLRRKAIAHFGQLGFPGPRTEDWRFTNVAPLARVPFRPAVPEDHGLTLRHLDKVSGMEGEHRLVFVNGYYAPALSSPPVGVTVTSLAHALATRAQEVEGFLGRAATFDDQPFTALNTAFFTDGAFVWVRPGQVIEKPIYLTFLSVGEAGPTAAFPRNLIVVGRGAMATLVETYAGLTDSVTFTCGVTEVVLDEGAVVDHYKVQEEGPGGFHVANTPIILARSSTFSTHYIGSGGSLVRNEVRALLDGEGAEATVNGLYRASGTQHLDNFTVIDHAKPHCATHELYKGILDGKARGVFNGKIFVRPGAQKTDAKQTNQTLVLSDDATIDTKPQLEIYADDVKCTHGATVGQLDAQQLFYLRSRGITLEQARALLTFAFANDVISRIKVETLRTRLQDALLTSCHLPRLELPEDE